MTKSSPFFVDPKYLNDKSTFVFPAMLYVAEDASGPPALFDSFAVSQSFTPFAFSLAEIERDWVFVCITYVAFAVTLHSPIVKSERVISGNFLTVSVYASESR